MSNLQHFDIDWESLVAPDWVGSSNDQCLQDLWKYDPSALTGAFDHSHLDRSSSTSSILEAGQQSHEATPIDWEDFFYQTWDDGQKGYDRLDNNIEYLGQVEKLQSFEPSETAVNVAIEGTAHHHALPRQTLNTAMDTITDHQITEPSPSSTSEQSEPTTKKPKRSCKRKPREKAPQPPQVIEKRYRSNLNDKIAELKAIVPTLRARVEGVPHGEEFLLAGLEPARTLKKSVVLAKTIEYIKHLENCNEALASQIVL